MKRRIPLLPAMIGLSFLFHGAAFLLLPGLRGPSSPPEPAESPAFSLVNIELSAAAVPPPPRPAPPAAPAVPAAPPVSAAGHPADETPSVEEGTLRDNPAETADPAVPVAAYAAPIVPAAAPGAGQSGSPADPSAAERRALTAAYVRRNFDYIQRRIREKLVYPPQARRTGVQGRAEAVFTVYPDGSIGGLEILAGSGQAILDQALTDAIRAAAPFPPPPVEARLVMPLTFRLR